MDVTSVREPGWLHPVGNSTSESLLHFPRYSHVEVLLLKHLLLKARHHLELATNQFWFIHINLTMGRANRMAGLSLMFGTVQLAPVPCLLPASCIGISLYLLMKKSFKKIWHEKCLTCIYQLLQCYCLASHYKMCCAFPVSVTVRALQIPWPLLSCYCLHPVLQWPELGSSSAGARAQLHKAAGAAWPKAVVSEWFVFTQPLPCPQPLSLPSLAGYSLCSRSSSIPAAAQVVLSCSNHSPPLTALRDKMAEVTLLLGSPVLALLPSPVFTVPHFTL